MKGIAPNVPYCGPLSSVHSYRPMFAPPGIGLARPPMQVLPLGMNETRWIPVMRMEDHHPVRFFYLAEGCSDMHLKATRATTRVCLDRLDALRRIAPSHAVATRILNEYCEHQIEKAAAQFLPWQMASGTHIDGAQLRAAVSNTGCLNEYLHRRMRDVNVDTLVLNYEVAGGAPAQGLTQRKIEIIHLGPLYGPNRAVCDVRTHEGCYYCSDSTLSRAMCHNNLTVHVRTYNATPETPSFSLLTRLQQLSHSVRRNGSPHPHGHSHID